MTYRQKQLAITAAGTGPLEIRVEYGRHDYDTSITAADITNGVCWLEGLYINASDVLVRPIGADTTTAATYPTFFHGVDVARAAVAKVSSYVYNSTTYNYSNVYVFDRPSPYVGAIFSNQQTEGADTMLTWLATPTTAAATNAALATLEAATTPTGFICRDSGATTINGVSAHSRAFTNVQADPTNASGPLFWAQTNSLQAPATINLMGYGTVSMPSMGIVFGPGCKRVEMHGIHIKGFSGSYSGWGGFTFLGCTEVVLSSCKVDCLGGNADHNNNYAPIIASYYDGFAFAGVGFVQLKGCTATGITNDGFKFFSPGNSKSASVYEMENCFGSRFGSTAKQYELAQVGSAANGCSIHGQGDLTMRNTHLYNAAAPIVAHSGGGLFTAYNCTFDGSKFSRSGSSDSANPGRPNSSCCGVAVGQGDGTNINAQLSTARLYNCTLSNNEAGVKNIYAASGGVIELYKCVTGTATPANNTSADVGATVKI